MENFVVITIGKKKRGFKFSMLTLEYFSEHTGVEFGDIFDHLKSKPVGSIIYLFLAANTVYEKGKNGSVSKFDVDDWIQEMSNEDYRSIIDCWNYSMMQIIKRLKSEDDEEGKKK